MWMAPSALAPRASSITSDDKSDAVTIATWVTLVTLIVVVLARQAIRFAVVRKLVTIDDLPIFITTIFAICFSVTSFVLASDGLGVFGALTIKRANALMKAYYASNFLYVLTIGSAKISLVTFFYSAQCQPKQRRYIVGFGIFLLAWTLVSVIAVAFQCDLPRPWEVFALHCYNRGAFWIIYCIIDMTTDVSIIMLSINLVAYLKIKSAKKVAVVACFAPRLLVIVASLARLVYLYPITPHDNPAFELWIPTVCTQVQICLAIVTACIPFMRPIFMGAESGIWRGEEGEKKRAALNRGSSYGCCSYTHLKGHRRGQNSSVDSSAFTNSKGGKTPDVSPRLPSPRPFSPLTPPRLHTSSSSTSGPARSPNERGLRLNIPTPEIHIRRATQPDITSPQTASSNALSPECLSPQALLSPPNTFPLTTPTLREPTPPRSHSPQPTAPEVHKSPDPNVSLGTSPPRFSLFPQPRAPRYSPLSQQNPNSALFAVSERSRSASRTPTQRLSRSGTPDVRTLSPNGPVPVSPPSQSTPRFSGVLFDDPLRTKTGAGRTSTPKPPPTINTVPAPPPYQARSSIPSYHVTTPPTAHTSDPSSLETIPSYYMHTPPIVQPPALSLPNLTPPAPHASEPVPAPAPVTNQSTSPQRQRNQRILMPQNSARMPETSPISPVTPPSFWREGDELANAAVQRGRFEEARMVDVVRVKDVRNSPQIVRPP